MFVRDLLCGLITFATVIDSLSYDPEARMPKGIKRIGKHSWGQPQQRWKLALAFPKDAYGTNEWVVGAALLSNETDESRPLITNSDGDGGYQITVVDERGKVVPKQNEVLAGFANLHTISVAGHSDYADAAVVSLWHNVTVPGTYRISISQRVFSTNGTSQVIVSSATNLIRVLNTDYTGTNGEIPHLDIVKP